MTLYIKLDEKKKKQKNKKTKKKKKQNKTLSPLDIQLTKIC